MTRIRRKLLKLMSKKPKEQQGKSKIRILDYKEPGNQNQWLLYAKSYQFKKAKEITKDFRKHFKKYGGVVKIDSIPKEKSKKLLFSIPTEYAKNILEFPLKRFFEPWTRLEIFTEGTEIKISGGPCRSVIINEKPEKILNKFEINILEKYFKNKLESIPDSKYQCEIGIEIDTKKCQADIYLIDDQIVSFNKLKFVHNKTSGKNLIDTIKNSINVMLKNIELLAKMHPVKSELFPLRMKEKIRNNAYLQKMPVEEIGDFSIRTLSSLKKAEIRTLGDLSKYNESELKHQKGFGQKSIIELQEQLTGLVLFLLDK